MSSHGHGVRGPGHASGHIAFTRIILRSDRREDTLRFETPIRNFDEVLECVRVAGCFDYLVEYVAADENASRRLTDALVTGDLGIASCFGQVMAETVFVKNFPSLPEILTRFA